jgi:molybdenum cofactor synthesis domain-containing protein
MSQTAGATTDRLLHPREAREIIDRFLYGLPEELIPIAEVPWRVLARDIVAAEDHPAFPAATMDGYAVVAEDPSPWREIVGRQTAGTVESIAVDLGTAAGITTGAPVPTGATAVVPVEETEIADDHVIIHHEGIEPGANIRPIGVDLARGTRVLEAGSLIGPAEIGMLAGLGVDPVPVVRRPRVSILSTGNELVEPARQPGPGQIRDSNRFSLIAATEETGAEVVWSGRGPDDLDALREALIARIAESDVVITSGGVSMGDLDLIKPLLGELAEVHFRRLFMKPGKPFNFATAGRTLLFGLPGNPVSALVGFEIFIRPALGALLGLREVDRPVIRVRLAQATQPSDRIEYQRAVVSIDRAGDLMARTTGSQASSRLASLLGANALVIIPPGAEPLAAGTRVDAVLIGPLQAEHGK